VIPAEVNVAVLGPVVVEGGARPFHRAAARELVVYLALHRRTVTYAEWPLAIWPDRDVSLATVHSTASDARRALGRTADGSEHLPRQGGHLRLASSVGTDDERFESLSAAADSGRIVEAMRLIRGPLFEGLRRADWAVLDGTQSAVESLVVRTALRGAEALLSREQGADAEWVVRRALVVSPYDERLYRTLLRATAAQGNRLALRVAMARLLTLAGDDAGRDGPGRRPKKTPLSCLHPETADLYRDLLRGSPATSGTPVRL
jgi:DNA-binding SARP family transcriptional activator